MINEYGAKMLELLEKEPEHMTRIMKQTNLRVHMKGYRPGKAPLGMIKNAIRNEKTAREIFYKVVMEEYFPDEDISDENPESMKPYLDGIVGRMASYALRGKEDDFPKELIHRAEDVIDVTGTESEDVNKSKKQDNEENETTSSDISLTEEVTKKTTGKTDEKKIEEKNENQHETGKRKKETTEQTQSRKGKTMKTKYLGIVQTTSTFYNFYPYAIVEENGKLSVITPQDRKELFPSKGNINIYTSDRYSNILNQTFTSGAFYVLDLPEEREENYTRDGYINQTNYKINVDELVKENAIHDPSEYCIYPAVEVPKLEEKLKNGVGIQLDNSRYGFVQDEVVLLWERLLLIGPCTAMVSSGMIATGLVRKNSILDAYMDDGSGVIYNVVGVDNTYGSNLITFACIKNLPVVKKDYISDEMLIKEFNNLIDKDNNDVVSTDTVLNSAFSGLPIPEEIVKSRQERLKKILAAQGSIELLTGDVANLVNKMLLKAAGENEEAFKEVFEQLANDPAFLNKFQRNQYIRDALDTIEEELDEKREQLDEIKKQLEDSKEKLANERADAINEEIAESKNELARINAELKESLKKAGLVDDIHKLEVKKGVAEELLAKLQKDQTVVEQNIKDALNSFEDKAKDPINEFTSYLLNERVAAVINDQIRKAGIPETDEKDNIVSKRCDFYSESLADASATVSPDDLLNRVKKYRGHYSKNDIINLYLCIANGLLTVFSGAPGTGKTSVCMILAHALGLDSYAVKREKVDKLWDDPEMANRFAMVSVERGWSSKRDFIGYYNPLTKTFDKANPNIYQALEIINCERINQVPMDKASPYMVLLDEANLSPMEYYWADFMPVCDRMSSDAAISLGEDKTFRITDALRFVATINNDFTTETLSPRLIDRAWVVALPQPMEASDTEFDDYYEPVSMADLLKLFTPAKGSQLQQASLDLLKEVYEYSKKQLGLNVSSRTDIAIKHYCMAGEQLFEKTEDGTLSAYIAIDYAVAQKILPAIRGSGEKYREKLEGFRNLLQRNNLMKSVEGLNRIIDVGDNNMMYFQYFA